MQKFLALAKKYPGLLAISGVWLLSFLLMLPLHDVAFQDDFAYIHTVRNFVATGTLSISEWVAPTTVFIAWWGALFSLFLGYSIKTLHFSNILLLYFAIVSFYLLLKKFNLGEFKATIFALLLFAYPLVYQFSYSVMTDTFHMSLLCISLYLYTKGIMDKLNWALVAGSVVSGLAFLTRQLGIALPAALLLIFIYNFLVKRGFSWGKVFFSVGPFAIIFILYYSWLNKVGVTIGGVSGSSATTTK